MPSPSQPISPAARIAAVLGYQPETAANEFVHAVADVVTNDAGFADAFDAAYRARDICGHSGRKATPRMDPHRLFIASCRHGKTSREAALVVLRTYADPGLVDDMVAGKGGGFVEACHSGDIARAIQVADNVNADLLPYFMAYCAKR